MCNTTQDKSEKVIDDWICRADEVHGVGQVGDDVGISGTVGEKYAMNPYVPLVDRG